MSFFCKIRYNVCMNIEQKCYLIEESYKLGMSLYECFLLAECTEEEITTLKEDTEFQKRLKVLILQEEKRLLEIHNQVITIAADKGNSKPIEWKLAQLKPDVYGTKVTKNLNQNVNHAEQPLTPEEKERIEKEFNYMFKER